MVLCFRKKVEIYTVFAKSWRNKYNFVLFEQFCHRKNLENWLKFGKFIKICYNFLKNYLIPPNLHQFFCSSFENDKKFSRPEIWVILISVILLSSSTTYHHFLPWNSSDKKKIDFDIQINPVIFIQIRHNQLIRGIDRNHSTVRIEFF